ncbi:hypothetical protein [Histophilus somni]|uniref:hypothetical protein n=1 Tax=Histophilus somni TaxID=731 RepID=UPI0038784203
MLNQINKLNDFHSFRTNLMLERLEETEAQITLLRRYVENHEDKTVNHGLSLLQDSLNHLLQVIRLNPDFEKKRGKDE